MASFDLSREQLEVALASTDPGGRAQSDPYTLKGTVSKCRGHGSLRFVDLTLIGDVDLTRVEMLQLIVTQEELPLQLGAVIRAVGQLGRARSSRTNASGQPSLYCTAVELLQPAPPQPVITVVQKQKRKANSKTVNRRSSSKRQARENQRAAASLADRVFGEVANSNRLMHSAGMCSAANSEAPAVDWSAVPPSLDPAASGQPGAIQTIGAGGDGRAQRKRWQVESVYRALWSIVNAASAAKAEGQPPTVTVVDFGSGSGNATLAIAWLMRATTRWVLVDAKPQAIELATQRAALAGLSDVVEARVGRIEEYDEPFDIGVAIHACGAATDYAQLQCFRRSVPFVLVPCCVGKIARDGALRALGQPVEAAALTAVGVGQAEPRSAWMRTQLSNEEWAIVVSVAGHSAHSGADDEESKQPEAADVRKKAKTLVEADRMAAAEEYTGSAGSEGLYGTLLGKLEPLAASPMNDMLVGWPLTMNL